MSCGVCGDPRWRLVCPACDHDAQSYELSALRAENERLKADMHDYKRGCVEAGNENAALMQDHCNQLVHERDAFRRKADAWARLKAWLNRHAFNTFTPERLLAKIAELEAPE